MNPLSPADSIHLQAAQEHLQHGRHPDAGLEIDMISPEQRSHPDVLEARWEMSAQAGNWEATLEISRLLRQVAPESQNGWTYLACSLAELKRTQEAYETLSAAFERFPQVPMIAYNLTCFACKMGRLKDASRWLAKAMEIGGRAEVKLMALDDPDLAPLLDEICAL
jgi:Flp pilus assembly protein TadD